MAMTGQGDRRKGNRRQGTRRKDHVEVIRTGGDTEQAVVVRHETAPQRKETSVWSWREAFVVEWSETLITKKRVKKPRKGEY